VFFQVLRHRLPGIPRNNSAATWTVLFAGRGRGWGGCQVLFSEPCPWGFTGKCGVSRLDLFVSGLGVLPGGRRGGAGSRLHAVFVDKETFRDLFVSGLGRVPPGVKVSERAEPIPQFQRTQPTILVDNNRAAIRGGGSSQGGAGAARVPDGRQFSSIRKRFGICLFAGWAGSSQGPRQGERVPDCRQFSRVRKISG
jgi:hypothetical protein